MDGEVGNLADIIGHRLLLLSGNKQSLSERRQWLERACRQWRAEFQLLDRLFVQRFPNRQPSPAEYATWRGKHAREYQRLEAEERALADERDSIQQGWRDFEAGLRGAMQEALPLAAQHGEQGQTDLAALMGNLNLGDQREVNLADLMSNLNLGKR